MKDLPDEIFTTNPKEAIAFCIAYGIEEQVLPPGFNMRQEGYTILEELLVRMQDKVDDERLTEMIILFVAGFAAGSGQIGIKKDGN